jgi:polysaccharide export outer membrane protein
MLIFGTHLPAPAAARPRALGRGLAVSSAAVLALLLVAGCATRGGSIPYDVKDFQRPDPPSAAPGVNDEDYRISPLDMLRINVFQVGDLSGEFQVDLGGNMTMPLIGQVRAVDLTTRQLQDLLAQRLGQRYLRNPQVTVAVSQSTRRNITVDGSVRQPGQYPLSGPTTLLQAVAMARGPDDNANTHRVAVFRQVQGQRMAAAFDLAAIRRGRAEDPVIYTGDIIVVDGGSTLRTIQREILSSLPLLGIFRPY